MQEPTSPPRRRRTFKVVLIASLALNLLFVGLIAGAVFRHGGPPRDRSGPPINGYAAPYMRALPKAERRALHEELRAQGALPKRGERRAVYKQMVESLRADPFDPVAVQDVLDAQSASLQKVLGASQDAWLSTVEGMTPEARRSYADAIEAQLNRKKRRRDRRKD